jgi:hypothetical protein
VQTKDWLLPVLFFPSGILAMHLIGPRVLGYELTESALLIRLGRRGPVLRRIAYEDILAVRIATMIDIVFAVKWLNRLGGSAVLLQLDRGWWRTIVVSPADPHRFVGALRQRIRPVLAL